MVEYSALRLARCQISRDIECSKHLPGAIANRIDGPPAIAAAQTVSPASVISGGSAIGPSLTYCRARVWY